MKAFVTGGAGQVGRYLIEALARRGVHVAVFDMVPELDVIPCSDGQILYFQGDILDAAALSAALASDHFDTVFHLAGFNSFAAPLDIYRTNVLGMASLLEAIQPPVKLVVLSSSAVYGACADDPIDEDSIPSPLTNYGLSKQCMEMMCRIARAERGLDIIIARPFNIIGPGQRGPLLHSAVASQIARCEAGLQEAEIRLGRLDAYRDFIDVRDVVNGLIAMATVGRPGEAYNLCSGVAIQAGDVVRGLIDLARRPIAVRIEATGHKAIDVPRQCGTYAKLRAISGWRPDVPLRLSLRDTLEFWRTLVA